ncbi:MAG: carboxypeptidase-like regulatory domain-containing protein [Pedobacter sp.]|uniref:carboxypeptidase-like regulatory domain-containing protein n=1 Tax=Pedobacter sp. TaxID=1411316 RepID=UPI00356A9E96
MKNLHYTLFLFLLLSCKPRVNNFYQGKVIDQSDKPIEGVIVTEEDSKEKQTTTDKKGYFKLDRSPDWLGRLIFIKDGYQTDTIASVWHQAGETTEYNFIETDTTIVRLKATKVRASIVVPSNSLFHSIESVGLPFKDSTNFDNFKESRKLTNQEAGILKLNTLYSGVMGFYSRYTVPFSTQFKSVVISYHPNEHELITTLINYDRDYHILGKVDIAYDEIAESQFRKESLLTIDKIIVDEISWMENRPVKKTKTYEVLPNGKIIGNQ